MEDQDEFLGKKKKKRAPRVEEASNEKVTQSIADSNRDYTYDELLARIPFMDKSETTHTIQIPQVVQNGKRTSFINFASIAKSMHRRVDHFKDFVLSELGTSGTTDASLRLNIKGKFHRAHIENVIRSYAKEYVTCKSCKSFNTLLQKDTRVDVLRCDDCGCHYSVPPINIGFRAIANKRKKLADLPSQIE
jgi:translation initiation factor 2 subunit 2